MGKIKTIRKKSRETYKEVPKFCEKFKEKLFTIFNHALFPILEQINVIKSEKKTKRKNNKIASLLLIRKTTFYIAIKVKRGSTVSKKNYLKL